MGPSSGVGNGESALVTGAGAGPWAAWATAGVELGVVAGLAAAAADSDIVIPVISTSGEPPLGLLSFPAGSTPQIKHATCAQEHCPNRADAYQVVKSA